MPKLVLERPCVGRLKWHELIEAEGGRILDGTRLCSVDPSGVLSDTAEAGRIIGCVAYPAATVIAPGVVRHVEIRLERDGAETERAKEVVAGFNRTGFKSRVITDIRDELWLLRPGAAFRSIRSAR
jgi:2-dehydropantoate 2-reductase